MQFGEAREGFSCYRHRMRALDSAVFQQQGKDRGSFVDITSDEA
jgi:hypothetical protein